MGSLCTKPECVRVREEKREIEIGRELLVETSARTMKSLQARTDKAEADARTLRELLDETNPGAAGKTGSHASCKTNQLVP